MHRPARRTRIAQRSHLRIGIQSDCSNEDLQPRRPHQRFVACTPAIRIEPREDDSVGCAAFTPGIVTHAVAIVLDPVWDLFAPQSRVFVQWQTVRVDDQTRALLFVLCANFTRPRLLTRCRARRKEAIRRKARAHSRGRPPASPMRSNSQDEPLGVGSWMLEVARSYQPN